MHWSASMSTARFLKKSVSDLTVSHFPISTPSVIMNCLSIFLVHPMVSARQSQNQSTSLPLRSHGAAQTNTMQSGKSCEQTNASHSSLQLTQILRHEECYLPVCHIWDAHPHKMVRLFHIQNHSLTFFCTQRRRGQNR